jgi:hypothetical protein
MLVKPLLANFVDLVDTRVLQELPKIKMIIIDSKVHWNIFSYINLGPLKGARNVFCSVTQCSLLHLTATATKRSNVRRCVD